MASFVYNVVYLNDQLIYTPTQCTFKFYHTNTSKLSSLRTTTLDNQIVFDTDDADINNQIAPFANGNIGLLFASTTINNIDYFAMLSVTSTGSDVYTGKIELKQSQPPTISINTFTPVPNYINENITINVTTSALYQWTYNSVIHYHKNSYYGITIFSKVAISKTEYQVLDELGNIVVPWQTSNIFKLSLSKLYTVKARTYNMYNQMVETSKNVFLYKHPITSLISHNPYNPMSKQDYTINTIVSQVDNNFVSQRLVKIVNNVETEVANSTNLDMTYTTQELNYQSIIYYKQYMTYNNGQSNIELSKTYNINMQLRPSILSIDTIIDSTEPDNDGDTQYNIVPTIDYGDGAFASLRYDLYFITPFSNIETKVGTYTKTLINDLTLNLTFTQNGRYKIFALLTDEFNGTSSDEKYIDITSDGLVVVTKKPIQDIIFDRE